MMIIAQLFFTLIASLADDASAFASSRAWSIRLQNENTQISAAAETSKDVITPKKLLQPEERLRIDSLVNERSKARWDGNYKRADEIRKLIDETTIGISWRDIVLSTDTSFEPDDSLIQKLDEHQHFKVVITDTPRSLGGESQWELMAMADENISKSDEDNVLQLAHAALGMVVSMSDQGLDVNDEVFDQLIARATARLKVLRNRKAIADFLPTEMSSELHGRKAADAALWFALAGVPDLNLYDELVNVSTEELLRFGSNSSCRAKDILHVIERIAMTGHSGCAVQRLYDVAAGILEAKIHNKIDCDDSSDEENDSNIDYHGVIRSLRDASFGLHSERPLLGLWRFSTRQRKQKVFLKHAASHYEAAHGYSRLETQADVNSNEPDGKYNWSAIFRDPMRPLVVDIGCGMGVSLLGLASQNKTPCMKNNTCVESLSLDWEKHNFIGVDLSRLGIRYAHGVCNRWGLDGHLQFIVDSAEACLSKIQESYPGNVEFPTPFRFKPPNATIIREGFNSQLPEDAVCGDFMVTETLLSEVCRTLAKTGQLLIQSNCEDVAVHMMNTAVEQVGFKPLIFNDAVAMHSFDRDNIPKRALDWQASGGERALGATWSSLSILPKYGRTETEVSCMLDRKPVHRCILMH
eukprot:scaffold7493_cov58-Cyclotella_meneghiniana.AAC.4